MTLISEEDQEEMFRLVMRTEHECAVCADTICFSDEIVVITVVVAGFDMERGIIFAPAEAEDGDFLYEPRFVEFACWENVIDELYHQLQDQPPVEDECSALSCKVCSSGIRLGELMGLGTKGELLSSPRMPEGVENTTFDAQDPEPDPVCIACLKNLSTNLVDLWESVEHNDECDEGTIARCWRHGCPGRSACMMRTGG